LDIGVLGYIGIVWPKEHSPEVWSVPPVTLCIYGVPPDDGLQIRLKHVEVDRRNILRINSASCWFHLYGYIEMHGQQNIKFCRPVILCLLKLYHWTGPHTALRHRCIRWLKERRRMVFPVMSYTIVKTL